MKTRGYGSCAGANGTVNLRTVWRVGVARFKGAHFATYPPKLVEPCVLAGTSAKGCCPSCGEPWVRRTSRERVPTRKGEESKVFGGPNSMCRVDRDPAHVGREVAGNRDPRRHVTRVETTGWAAGCECGGEPVPCVVLDPFLGSGTTLAVAVEHRRWGYGIDLNPGYLSLARRRLGEVTPTLFGEG